ncbi:MAG: hypothetical protein ACYC5H_17400 [Methylovirgula sp.]
MRDKENDMLHEKIKSTRAARSLLAGVLAFGVVGGAAALSVSSAAAQIFYPPPDVAGSVSDRVQAIYNEQFAPAPGYYGDVAMQAYALGYRAGAAIPMAYRGTMMTSP